MLAVAGAGVLAITPSAAKAQDTTASVPKTHTVKKGDTLWDLAAHYLGDAFRWPELYRLNTDVVEDPHWIYPGEILKLPGYIAVGLPGLAEPGRDSVAVTPPTPVQLDTVQRPAPLPGRTVFSREPAPQPQPTTAAAGADTLGRTGLDTTVRRPQSAVRTGDYDGAPWIDRLKGPPVWGRIVGSAELPGIEASSQRARFQINDRVLIAPPTGYVGQERERYLTYRNGPLLEEVGQVIIPTGIVEVLRPPVNGEAAIARVVRMFSEVNERDRLMPYDSGSLFVSGTPMPVKDGPQGEIRWVAQDPVLPAPTYYILISLTARDGIRPGDEIELYQARQKAREEGALAIPEIRVGRAQVIKVTPQGATAMITRLDQPKVEAYKTKVRVIGRIQ